eukprot:SAG25_NODE_411_length_8395_cov_6.454556_11_plen_45_part_00
MTAAASALYLNDLATAKNRSRTTAPTTVMALIGFAAGNPCIYDE